MSSLTSIIYEASEKALAIPLVMLLCGSIYLSFKTRFIQLRAIPRALTLLFSGFFSKKVKDPHAIRAHKALFTAMATTLGVGNLLGPIVAISFGGPGALLGFMLAAFFGGASKFTEVAFALKHRKRYPDGRIAGGPMQYIKTFVSSKAAAAYAILTFLMLMLWQSSQANALAGLLEPLHIPALASGIIFASLILVCLVGGIKRVGNIATKLVPTMFLLFSTSGLWIIFRNIEKLPSIIKLIFQSAFTPQALVGAAVGTGFYKAMRWGLAKGTFSNEAGLGTAAIPHSKSAATNPIEQGTLSIFSVYADAFLSLLSGFIVLITGVWQEPGAIFNMTMLSRAYSLYFPIIGPIILTVATLLFAFTSLMGNSYNGSQCFLYVTKNRVLYGYYGLIAIAIIVGAVAELKLVWSLADFFMVPVALINIISLIVIIRKEKLV